MRVIANSVTTEMGDVETAATIGIVDYSKRVTDDFGVTTVVQRGFSRTLSVKIGLPFDNVDALQQRLASLRATPAQWFADDRFAWLSPTGFFKDFDIDLSVPPLSYCTLTVEGFAEIETLADPGGDPALDGSVSTLRLLQPVAITDAMLINSSVAETDAPEWAAATVYPLGARIMKAASHRLYESLIAGNTGNDPTVAATTQWLDVGPTSRWAMFDQAIGTTTDANGSIVVTLGAGAVTAVALLDTIGATARVQAPSYDVTTAIGAGATTFLDLPGGNGQVTVTITGNGAVSCGTLLIGQVVDLGVTEASPGSGITDYSRKDIDDFGAVTIVQRAWAKRMTAKALIRTDAVDIVANRIASVRAQPSLWIGQAGVDSLTVYGFFKDFSIEVSETTSKLSLSIEGLSTAAKIAPLATSVSWPDVTDPLGTKPSDNADKTSENTSNDTSAVAGRDSFEVISDIKTQLTTLLQQIDRVDALRDALAAVGYIEGQTVANKLIQERTDRVSGDTALQNMLSILASFNSQGTAAILNSQTTIAGVDGTIAQAISDLVSDNGLTKAQVQQLFETVINPDGSALARALLQVTADNAIAGLQLTAGGEVSALKFLANIFQFTDPNGGQPITPFYYKDGILYLDNVYVNKLTIKAVADTFVQSFNPNDFSITIPGGLILKGGTIRGTIGQEAQFNIVFPEPFPTVCLFGLPLGWIAGANNAKDLYMQALGDPTPQGFGAYAQASTGNAQSLDGVNWFAIGK